MTITKAELVDKLRDAMPGSDKLLDLGDTNSSRADTIIDNALDALAKLVPKTLIDTITLLPGVMVYDAPTDMWDYKETSWGVNQSCPPWEDGYVAKLPVPTFSNGKLMFNFAPTAKMLAALGSAFTFFYYADYNYDGTPINVEPRKQGLLLLLCQMEAMKMLMIREASTQVTVKTSTGKIQFGSPQKAYDLLKVEAAELAKTL